MRIRTQIVFALWLLSGIFAKLSAQDLAFNKSPHIPQLSDYRNFLLDGNISFQNQNPKFGLDENISISSLSKNNIEKESGIFPTIMSPVRNGSETSENKTVFDHYDPPIGIVSINATIEIGSPGPNTTIECTVTPNFTAPTATGDCPQVTVIQVEPDITSGNSCIRTVTRTWFAVDACGNSSGTVAQTITLVDTQAPVIGNAGANTTIECSVSPSFQAPTASDACNTYTVVQVTPDQSNGNTCLRTVTRTWYAVDACGNTSGTRQQTITIKDTQAPTISNPINVTIECTATATFTVPTASDACSGVTVIPVGPVISGGNSCDSTITRTWRAVDACGNSSGTVSQTITIRDSQPPIIGSPGANATIECTTTPSFTPPTAIDACNGATVRFVSNVENIINCTTKIRTITWRAVDGCGNSSNTVSQTLTLIDTQPPTISGISDVTIECTATPTFSVPFVTDVCNIATFAQVGSDVTASNNCVKTITRTWRAEDACGNSTTDSQTITIIDSQAPVIGFPGANTTIDCDIPLIFTPPTANDACNGATVNFLGEVTSGNNCVKTITRSWDATDACGKHSATRTQTITVVDVQAPIIGPAGADVTIECTVSPVFSPPTATDACNGATINILSTTTNVNNNCLKSITRSWDASDACGNHSATRTQTITIIDSQGPTIGNAGTNATIECTATPNFTQPTASDACNGATVNLLGTTTSGNNCVKIITRSWDAIDACGNHSVTRTQTFTIVDSQGPTIGNAGANATIECTATPVFTAPPTASDACNGATINYLGEITSGNTCVKLITRNWDATDACGNHSVTRSQTITVIDTQAPVIGTAGANVTIECTATPNFTPPTASDACSGVTVNLLNETTGGNNCIKTITRRWDATDICGNHSVTRTQTITVVDTKPPTLTPTGGNATIDCNDVPSFQTPIASDDCNGATVNILSTITSGNNCVKTITRRWDATDACGNHSATVSQTITLVDLQGPIIGFVGSSTTIECTDDPESFFGPPTVIGDDCNNATVNLVSETITGNNCVKTITRRWDATDACGNHSNTLSQSVTVIDSRAPIISPAGFNATIECTDLVFFTPPVAFDDCNGATINLLSETTGGNNCVKTITRSWDATDACGYHSFTRTQTITIIDTLGPVISPQGEDATIDCTETPVFTPPTASDACNGATVNFLGEITSSNNCFKTIIRRWDATDVCGNHSETISQTITVTDLQAPVIGSAGVNATIQCTATPNFSPPTASDACNGATVNFLGETTSGSSCVKTITRSWDATDACGNHSATRTQTITVIDSQAPVIGVAGANTTVECTATPTFTPPTASDICSGVTINLLGEITGGTSCVKTITRNWDATDACGNHSVTRTQTITFIDLQPPVISVAGANATVECTATPIFTPPTASDFCSSISINLLSETTNSNNCIKTVTRSWDATDACGNHSVTRSQTITIIDSQAPVIGPAGTNTTIECTATPNFTSPSASDVCSGVTVNLLGDVTTGNNCIKTVTRSWDATDACGNHSATRTQTITIIDTQAPLIGTTGANTTIECTATPNFTPPTASDICNGATVNFIGDVTGGNNCIRTITRSWDATDACGNHSATRSQTITIIDTQAPIIGTAGANTTIECTATPNFTPPTANDVCNGATVNFIGDVTGGNNCIKTITRSWDATDACGNHSATRTQTITIIDTQAPLIGTTGANTTIECTATPNFTPPTASDICNGATVNFIGDVTGGNNCIRTITRSWDATDACGNHSATRTQTITIIDSQAPLIGAAGTNTTIECTAIPNFTPPTAIDACNGATVNFLGDVTSGNNCFKSITRSWDATDACGNHSATRTQTITIIDLQAPVIGAAGPNTTIECTATPNFTPPTASDACNGATINFIGDVTGGNNCVKTITRSWDATDACGNHSATRSQTITIIDSQAPLIGTAGANTTIECTVTPNFTPPTANDVCNGATVNFIGDITSGNNCIKTITRSWDATDACGNHSATRTQIITIIDSQAPLIGTAGANTTIECTATPNFTPPTANDICNGATVNFIGDLTGGNNCIRTITRSWDATDACGNHSATRTQTIIIIDSQAPLIGAAGINTTIECTATPNFTPPTASDACNGATVNFLGETTSGNNCIKTVSRSWDATDACGNHSVTRTQTITIIDSQAPLIGSPGANTTIECTATPNFTLPTASDACNGATVNFLGETTSGNNCIKTITRSWDATDACGNHSATRSQTITIIDSQAPLIGTAGANITIECTVTPNFTPPTANDVCNGATVNFIGDITSGNNCIKTITRSWDATDACGNHSATRTQTITIIDSQAPLIGTAGANTTIECTATPNFTPPTANDICNGATVNFLGDITNGNNCIKTITRSWDATDACGNHSATRSQSITVIDTQAPTIGSAGVNSTIECTATPNFTPPTASDACNGASVNFLGETTSGNNCIKTITRSWDATDACGNHSATRTQTITIIDSQAPVIGAAGVNGTIECTATPVFTPPTASDACNGATVNFLGEITSGNNCVKTITRSWDATDACGNHSVTRSQMITFIDSQAPVIGSAGTNTTIECTATPNFTPPTASDACNGATVNFLGEITSGNNCVKTITRSWDATDACGNHSATRSQMITIIDSQAPVIGAAGTNTTIECTATPNFTPPTVSDACNGATVNFLGEITGGNNCMKTITRSWDATDVCGNHSITRSQTITIIDSQAPTIGNTGANATIECSATPNFTPPTASDACSGTTVNFLGETTSGNNCIKTITRSWDATDACGNHSVTRSQTLTIIDTQAPIIGNAGANATIECTVTPIFVPPTTGDACNGAIVNFLGETTSSNNCIKTITRSWDATDACGNHSATRTQTITIIDSQAPVIGAAGVNGTIECTATPVFTPPTASDACNGATVNFLGETTSGNNCIKTITRSWDATDACGNHSTTRTQTITIVDSQAPAIGAAGTNATIECTATPSFSPPTASDLCTGATINFLGETTTGNNCTKTITRSWDAIDACGNHSATRTQSITIIDTQAPVIGTAGANATIECTATPVFTLPTASDVCNGATINFLGEITGGNNCIKTITRSWDATDACGNHSVTRTQTITIVDSQAPTIGNAGANATIECTATPSFTPPTASDICNGATVNFLGETTSGNNCLKIITRNWDATDACGNHSVTRTQIITIIDSKAPVINCPAPQVFCGPSGNFYSVPPVIASDNCSSSLVYTYQITGATTTNGTGNNASGIFNAGISTITWTVTDECGNTSTCTITVTVNNQITPTFNPVGPICSGDVLAPLPTISLNGVTGSWAPALNNTATTTYTFTPDAGQCATSATLTITVNPILTATINCGVSTTSSVIFTWAAVSGATDYTVSYQVNAGPVVNVGAIGNVLSYQVTGLAGGDNVSITITPTGSAGTCFSAATATCTAVACTPPTASISYAGPFCNNIATLQSVNLTGTGNFTGGTYSALPGLSLNSATGDIIPGTSTPGSYIVTYTIAASGGCPGVTATTTVIIETLTTPTFNPVTPICSGDVLAPLPTMSLNGITGSWTPAINNTATTTYTFTPNAGQCAASTTLTITVNPNITPTFNPVAPICSGDPLTALPTTSLNGIVGSWAPALNNTSTTTYTFTPNTGQCATTTTLTITVNIKITPTFNPVTPICSGDVLTPLPTTSLNGITGSWAPALNNTATATYTFTPDAGQCATTTTLTITINSNITPTFNPVAPICSGDVLAPLPTTSLNGITGSWAPAQNNTATTTYTFTPNAGQCATTTTLTIIVNPIITPTFNPVSPICSGDVLAPLPTTSLNGITGSWTPALNNTATTTYTFTPNAGQCATTTTLTITVNSSTTPTFNPVAPICSGDVLTPLPTTSLNGITGSWAPALNNTATTTYTFTPDAGQCATTATLTITVNPILTATINCGVSTTSSVTFTWAAVSGATGYIVSYQVNAGSVVNVGDIGNVLSYQVTGLASSDNVTITVTPTGGAGTCFSAATATCTAVACTPPTASISYASPFCNNITTPQPVNLTGTGNFTGGTYSALPGLTLNATTGDIIPSTSTPGTYTVTYTIAASGGCPAVTATTTIRIDAFIIPTFFPVDPICAGTPLTPLPTTSLNGITGSWSPALNNTTTNTYTFTPDAGQCATTTTLTITVNSNITPTFNPVAPICSGDALAPLPTTSLNGITGSWAPALINTATTTYTFTPDAAQCASTTTLTITVNPIITPTFNTVAPICSGDVLAPLPTTSLNGITGSWAPALNNTATTTYTFTPDAGQCASTTTLTITVNPNITPTFNPVAPICSGDVLTPLPTTSLNGITGSWAPALNNTSTTTYTFTPDAGQCATTATLTITVNPILTATINCGVSTTSSVTFTWAAVSGATGYTVSYIINAGPVVNVGDIGSVLSYQVTGLASGGNVTITVTPTGGAGTCFSAATATCAAVACTPPTASISYSTPFCNNITTPQSVNLTGTGNYTGGTYSALPGLTLNATTGDIIPSTSTPGTYTVTYTIAASGGCPAVTATATVVIDALTTPTFNPVAPICSGDVLTPLPTTSLNGITGSWAPALNNTSTTTYTFTPDAGQCATTATLTITINPILTATINCGVSTTSSVTFTWAAVSGATGYTVSYIVNAGPVVNVGDIGSLLSYQVTGLASGDNVTITVTPTGGSGTCFSAATATCTAVACTPPTASISYSTPFCNNITTPQSVNLTGTGNFTGGTYSALPGLILNSASGEIIPSTSTPGTYNVTYTIAASGGCPAVTATATVVIDALTTPTFNPVAPICSGDVLSPLPTTSLNGITGFWAPALNNTSTTTYTFTPDAGQCATSATLTITVNPILTATINCGVSTTSSVTFTWAAVSGATGYTVSYIINTGPVVNVGDIGSVLSYQVTGLASGDNVTITVTPTSGSGTCFSAATATCAAVACTPPTASISYSTPFCNNITTPQSVNLTGTGNFTGGTYSALPGLTLNSTTGDIIPGTSTPGTYTVTYMIAASGGCPAVTATATVVIDALITSTFNPVAPICSGDVLTPLPTTSLNGITGSWSPALNNTATTIYTFTPDAGQCASTTTLTLTVNPNITPTFSPVAPICSGDVLAPLPNTSLNGITGSWTPALNNTTTTTYTFTPDGGQCATTTILTITVNPATELVINQPSSVCEPATVNLTAPAITAGSSPGLTYTYWMDPLATIPLQNPAAVNTSGTYYIKATGTCGSAKTGSVTVTISKATPATRYPTLTVRANTPLQLNARNIGASYLWSPAAGLSSNNIINPVFNYDKETEYKISITNGNGCITVDTVLVKIIPADQCDVLVPNAWSPNGDGHNDKLMTYPLNLREIKYFRVFNRWGQLVFETNVLGEGWDGRFNGKPQVEDVYTWTAEATCINGQIIKRSGNAVLIR